MVPWCKGVIRVGFVLTFRDQEWLGGVSYFRNLFAAVRAQPDRRIEPVIITRTDISKEALSGFGANEAVRTKLVEQDAKAWKLRRASQVFLGRDFLFERLLRRHHIRLLSHSGHLGRHCPIPTLTWIPDFQDRVLPAFFSEAEREARARGLKEACTHASAILLSSRAARSDLAAIDPHCAGKSRVLQFVCSVPDPATLLSREQLARRYGISGSFFLLPNQFWAHKNHLVVIEALARLRAGGRHIKVLATGSSRDHRQPHHFAAVLDRVRELGVGSQFQVLGLVPYIDLMSLMRESVAVINPSLFEGWSTTIEEAKSMGKRAILSDIPVHREQAPERATYFDPEDPGSLARALEEVDSAWDAKVELQHLQSAVSGLPLRVRAFAENYQRIVLDILGGA
ncbi:MAG TPA: glycosyltransferase family 1 protein [Pseudolabrys sp.]|nr:glycosyltransferase family 1 protein [Pseudolabrys sp.]